MSPSPREHSARTASFLSATPQTPTESNASWNVSTLEVPFRALALPADTTGDPRFPSMVSVNRAFSSTVGDTAPVPRVTFNKIVGTASTDSTRNTSAMHLRSLKNMLTAGPNASSSE